MRSSLIDRRGFLTVGALAGSGITLAELLRVESAQAAPKAYANVEAKAKSVIHIYLPGGIAHQSRSTRCPTPRSSIAAKWE
ncbi:MAG: hypothetical protein R3C10_24575 [Pirellulales bacterium]